MNKKPAIRCEALPFLALGAGGVGLVLRVLLYTLGVDDRGLLPRWHFLHVLTLALSICLVLFLALTVKDLGGSARYRANFPADTGSGIAILSAAPFLLGAVFSVLTQAQGLLAYVHGGLGLLAVAATVATGILRLRGGRPFFGFHFLLCLFYAVHMVCCYRVWSANPQTADYLFHIFACVMLTLTAYYRTAFDLGMGRRRLYLMCCLLSVYLCFLCLVGQGDPRFYVSGGLWALGNLCSLTPPPRRPLGDTQRIPNTEARE